jgi:NAD(P)-dependent dehydrogenase (short-subunit alcohol dehydrogenase family)
MNRLGRDMAGRICMVTGANSGIGLATASILAERGATVVMVCRSGERGEAAKAEIERSVEAPELVLMVADLAHLERVRELAEKFQHRYDRLDALVNNAGVYVADRRITVDGYEETLAVNHLASFLLTNLLLGRLKTASGRVITISSDAHKAGRLDRAPLEEILRGRGPYNGMQAYADSKLANLLFTFELARRIDGTGVTANALHPGTLATQIWNQNRDTLSIAMRLFKPFMGAPRKGGEAVARLVANPELDGVTGRYFDRLKEGRAATRAHDHELAARLWRASAELTSWTDT